MPDKITSVKAKLGISISLTFLSLAFITANRNPATSYEPSIYSGTPIYYWLFLLASITAAAMLVVTDTRPLTSVALISAALATVLSLPLLRGYWMIGGGDPMSHLSQSYRVSNNMGLLSTFYPGVPSLVEVMHEVTDLPIRIVLMALGPIFVILFVIFMALITRQLTLANRGLVIGAIVGLLLLPINLVATHIYPHPNSFAILFASVGVYLSIALLRSSRKDKFATIIVFSAAMVLYHPQQALNVIAAIAMIGTTWEITRRGSERIRPNPLVTVSAVMGIIWAIWVLAQSKFENALISVVTGILAAGEVDPTAGRGNTLTQLGSGVIDLVLRLFFIDLVALLFGGLSTIFALSWAARQAGLENQWLQSVPIDRVTTDHQAIIGVICAIIPVMIFFGMFLASGLTQQFMRFFGFGMLLVSILVGVGLTQTTELAARWNESAALSFVVIVVLTASLFGAALTYHTSPMNFRDTGHVTEATVIGFETQFEHHDGAEMMGVRTPIWRYAVALEPEENAPMLKYTGTFRENSPPDHFANQSLHQRYSDDRVVVTTSKGRWLDTSLYDGIRYSSDDYAYLDRQPGIDRTYANGDVTVYYISGNSTS